MYCMNVLCILKVNKNIKDKKIFIFICSICSPLLTFYFHIHIPPKDSFSVYYFYALVILCFVTSCLVFLIFVIQCRVKALIQIKLYCRESILAFHVFSRPKINNVVKYYILQSPVSWVDRPFLYTLTGVGCEPNPLPQV